MSGFSVDYCLECLKGYGRVTVSSQTYNPQANSRLDRWKVMVSVRGTGRIVKTTHGDLYWAANQALEKMRRDGNELQSNNN